MPNYGEFGLDNTRFKHDIEEAKAALNGIGKTAEQNASTMDSAFKKAGQMAAGYFSIQAAAGFVSQLVQVRGEFQKLEVGFTTMLGSKEKSNQLMAQMVDTAMKTPFTLQEVAGGAKQLLAYQVAQQDINKTLIELGNISAGLGVPIGRLIMVYGQVKAKGKLMGDDLRQFTEAGVPMVHELAKQMGVADSEVTKLITSGKVGFPEVQAVIHNLTGEGGMFFNLMAAQSLTVTGQLSNLQDAWSKMLNQIGADNDGLIYGAISGVSSLITNYETVGKIVESLIITYGVYKAALMVSSIATAVELGLTSQQVIANIGKVSSLAMATTATQAQTVANIQGTAAQSTLNAVIMANPYVFLAAGIVAVVGAMWALQDNTTAQEAAQQRLNDTTDAATQKKDELSNRTQALTGTINDQNRTLLAQVTAFEELKNKYPELLANLDLQMFKALGATQQQKLLNKAMEEGANKELDRSIQDAQSSLGSTKDYSKNIGFVNKYKDYWLDMTSLSLIFEKNQALADKEVETAEIYLKKLQDQKAAKEEMVRLAEIEALPEAEKIAYYDQQIELIKKKIELLGGTVNETIKVGNSVEKANEKWQLFAGNGVPEFVTTTDILLKGFGISLQDAINKKNKLVDPNTKAKSKWTKDDWENEKKIADDLWDKTTAEVSKKDKAAIKARIDAAKKALSSWDISDSSANKAESTADKLKKERSNLTKDIEKETLDEKRRGIDMAFASEQAIINVKTDGFEKELAQLILNNKKKEEEIKRAAEKELELEQQKADKIWSLTAQRDKKGNLIGEPPKVSLSAPSVAAYGQARSNNTAEFDFGKQNLLDKLAKEYQSFDDQRREIDKKYSEDEKSLNANFTGAALTSKLAELRQKTKEAYQQVDKDQADSAFKNNALLVSLFDDMAGKSVADLRKVADEAASLFDYLKNTAVKDITPKFGLSVAELTTLKLGKAEMKDIATQIKTVNDQADLLETGFKKVSTSIKKISEAISQETVGNIKIKEGKRLVASGDVDLIKEGKALIKIGMADIVEGAAKAKEGIKGLAEDFKSVSNYASMASGLLSAISTQEGDVADQAVKSIDAVMKIATPVVDALAKGDYAGAAIALVVGTLTQIFEAEKAHQEALKKLQDEKTAQQKAYNDLLIQQNKLLKDAETIFGADAYAKAIGYAQQADQYRNLLFGGDRTGDIASRNTYPQTSSKNNYNQGAMTALESATVQTGSHKGGLFGWGGEVKDYSSLLSTYKDLINADGTLNKERAQAILDNESLDETSRAALQSALDYTKDYEAALKSMSDYLNSVFGSLGENMMKAITDNLNDSQAALKQFGVSAGQTIEKLMTDIAYSMFFADKFKEMSDAALAIQKDNTKTPEEKAAEQQKLLADFYNGIGTEIKDAQDFLKNSKDAATKAGFSIFNDTARTATAKGIATASQESVDENNGRLTAMQGHTYQINESVKILALNSPKVLLTLMGIKDDTGGMRTDITAIKQGISDINMKGIYLKV